MFIFHWYHPLQTKKQAYLFALQASLYIPYPASISRSIPLSRPSQNVYPDPTRLKSQFNFPRHVGNLWFNVVHSVCRCPVSLIPPTKMSKILSCRFLTSCMPSPFSLLSRIPPDLWYTWRELFPLRLSGCLIDRFRYIIIQPSSESWRTQTKVWIEWPCLYSPPAEF